MCTTPTCAGEPADSSSRGRVVLLQLHPVGAERHRRCADHGSMDAGGRRRDLHVERECALEHEPETGAPQRQRVGEVGHGETGVGDVGDER